METTEEYKMAKKRVTSCLDKQTEKDAENFFDEELVSKDTEFRRRNEPDNVNHPPHYNQGKIESIDYIKDSLGEGFNYYLEGSVKKYMHRWRYKYGDTTEGSVEDLRKARWYLDRLIKNQVVDKK